MILQFLAPLLLLGTTSSTTVEVDVRGNSGRPLLHLTIQEGGEHSQKDSILSEDLKFDTLGEHGILKHEKVSPQFLQDIHEGLYFDHEDEHVSHYDSDDEADQAPVHPRFRRAATQPTKTSKQSNSVLQIQPELWIVMDYENSKAFNFDQKAILQYLSVFFKAASQPFNNIKEFRTSLKITNVTIITSPKANPYSLKVTDTKTLGPVNLQQTNDDGAFGEFQEWVRKTLGNKVRFSDTYWTPDIILLLQSTRLADNRTGTPIPFGAEARSGYVCNVNPEEPDTDPLWPNQAAVVFNTRGVPDVFSTLSATYAIASILGAENDGADNAKGCKAQDGYLMSGRSVNYNTNGYRFSKCSVELMLKHIKGEGKCLNRNGPKELVGLSANLPGSIFPDMKAYCNKRYPGFKNNVPTEGKTPDQLCAVMTCKFMDPKEKLFFDTRGLKYPAPDGLPCDKNKVCFQTKCVESKNVPKQ